MQSSSLMNCCTVTHLHGNLVVGKIADRADTHAVDQNYLGRYKKYATLRCS